MNFIEETKECPHCVKYYLLWGGTNQLVLKGGSILECPLCRARWMVATPIEPKNPVKDTRNG